MCLCPGLGGRWDRGSLRPSAPRLRHLSTGRAFSVWGTPPEWVFPCSENALCPGTDLSLSPPPAPRSCLPSCVKVPLSLSLPGLMAGSYLYASCSPLSVACLSEFSVLVILSHWYMLRSWTSKLYQVKEARCCTSTFIRNVQIGKSIDNRLGLGRRETDLGFFLGDDKVLELGGGGLHNIVNVPKATGLYTLLLFFLL